jgi:hypothetical protein
MLPGVEYKEPIDHFMFRGFIEVREICGMMVLRAWRHLTILIQLEEI